MSPELSLLQLVGACFDENEVHAGWLHRAAPFPDAAAAAARYRAWRADLERLLGPPVREEPTRAEWAEVRLKVAGRGVGLWLRPGDVWTWWNDPRTWRGDPIADVSRWDDASEGRDPWDPELVAELRGAVYSRDGKRVLAALAPGLPGPLHSAGAGVLAALADGLTGANEVAARLVDALRERAWDGDEILAEELEAAMGVGPIPLRQPLDVDLDEVSMHLHGGMDFETVWIDLRTGDLNISDEGLTDEEAEHALEIGHVGSHAGYRDMEDFIETVEDRRLASRLSNAIHGRGAFRRFRDIIDGSALRDRWLAFSEDRRVARTREWLAGCGFRPLP